MSQPPDSWEHFRLDEISELITDGTHHSPPNGADGEFKYVTAKNIRPHGVDLEDISYVSNEVHKGIYSRAPVRYGDVLYVKDGVGTGLAAVNNLDEQFSLLSSVALISPIRDIADSHFIKHWLNSPNTFQRLTGQMTGSAIRRLVLRQIRSAEIALPPLAEQRRIVAKIEALMARSRRAKAALAAIPPLIARYRQAVLAAAFRGDLTADWRAQNPDVEPATTLLDRIRTERRHRWEEAELAKLRAKGREPEDDQWKAKYKNSMSRSSRSRIARIPETWRMVSVDALSICLDAIRIPISRKEREQRQQIYPYLGANGQVGSIDEFLFDDDLILVTEDETFYGRTAPISYRFKGKCWVNNHAHVLVSFGNELTQYLHFALMHYNVEPWLTGTTGRAKLTQAALRSLPIPLAPEPEISILIQRLQQAFTFADAASRSVAEALPTFGELDQSILAKAFRGELVPQDPNDEPASVLLERIRAERAASPKPKRGRGRPKMSQLAHS